jgi:hypothetical protein
MVNLLASAGGHLFGRLWSQAEQDQEQYDDPVEWDDFAEWDDPVEEFEAETWELTPRTEPSPTRWAITFTFIAVLIVIFSAIVFFGFIQADWLYGTYSEISEAQWEQIANLRDELAQLGIAPEAVVALDDALLLPRPSTQDVLRDLKTAARALDQHSRITAARRVQDRLYALIGAIESPSIEPGYERPTAIPWATPTPTPGPTSTPILDAPVAQNNHDRALGSLP